MWVFPDAFLPWLSHLGESKTLGLTNGSLYDVLTASYPNSGTASVKATGFNITCGYIPEVTAKKVHTSDQSQYNISFPTEHLQWSYWVQPGYDVILLGNQNEVPTDSVILYTQNSVLDSDGKIGPIVNLSHSNVTVQFLQCSNSVISQVAQVDTGSKQIIHNSLDPPIHKCNATWLAYKGTSKMSTQQATSLLQGNNWAHILSGFDGTSLLFDSNGYGIDWGSMYLMQQLHLEPSTNSNNEVNQTSQGHLLHLHDIENAISNLMAATFWIGGHIRPSTLALEDLNFDIGNIDLPILDIGNTTVQQAVIGIRLNMSLLAISVALGASIVLLILVLKLSAGTSRACTGLEGLGLLQTIWVFEHHPELAEILEQVGDPTEDNLRTAGLVKVRLSDALQAQEDK